MKPVDWSAEKNEKLKEERGISFEEINDAIANNDVLDSYDHPNQKKYPGQKIMVVKVDDYAYLVPYVEDETKYFLKTAFPSRKATKKYIIEKKKL
ncbi:toxin [Candidatus Gottesmanbacteria bacterium RIFCSPHIGHO2_01_FULL_47_48]|uniref:Toxin n=1 Tax=Candidatus Gottesmanbacteria bacterium RIFCSPHIGHO2_01_FULL_47_48 TaxID=1798381 RepID=A0A1F6A2B8_9BACT|nr:MAG: toxin [Candidatus Gottesmanbacteria bacterium RIFCSPHIGHO2_01_FULL_47_48]